MRNSPSSVIKGRGHSGSLCTPFESKATLQSNHSVQYVAGAINLSFALMKFSFGKISKENPRGLAAFPCSGPNLTSIITMKFPLFELTALTQGKRGPAITGEPQATVRHRTRRNVNCFLICIDQIPGHSKIIHTDQRVPLREGQHIITVMFDFNPDKHDPEPWAK